MKHASNSLVAGIAALALLAGCDLTGETNKAEPANEAGAGGDGGAPPAPRPFDPFKLKIQPVFQDLRVNAESEAAVFMAMLPVEIVLPAPSNALGGRIYIVHARAGPVRVRASGGIDGHDQLTLARGQSAMLMSDGRDTYVLINPVSGG